MRVLILGAGGQLGRALVASAPEGADVRALTRAQADVTDPDALRAAFVDRRPALVLNAAAYTAVDAAETDQSAAFALNRDAVGALAALCAETAARLVHVSTDFVFDGDGGRPYRPDDPIAPHGIYARSKAEGEAAAFAAPGALVVRTAWVYAAEGKNFVRTMLRSMRERDEVRVVADQVGTPTHAASLARALWALAARGAAGLHHWTDAGVASWYDFAVAIQEEALALGLLDRKVPVVPIRTEDYPTPVRRPAHSVLDKTDTWADIGPARHWREELRLCLAEMKDLGP